LLEASGRLNKTVGGKSMVASDPQQSQRTVYSMVSRFQLDPLLSLLDFPDPNTHAERRSLTTTPLQKLFALNSPFLVQRSNELAQRVMELPAERATERVQWLYEFVLARQPDDEELRLAVSYLDGRSNTGEGWE
jgi:hypothetical protein